MKRLESNLYALIWKELTMRYLFVSLLVLVLAACDQNKVPVAAFSLTPESGAAPLEVTVDSRASTDADGATAKAEWDWGDGSATDTGATAIHTYSKEGTFTIKLTVTDDKNQFSSIHKTVTVTASDPNQEPGPQPDEPNGTVDTTFGEGGLAVYGTENSETARDAVLLPDGTIVVVGSRRDNIPQTSDGDVALVLFFNQNGTLKHEVTFPDLEASTVAVQKNGDVLVAGRGTNPATDEFVFWLRRLKADGTLDTNFGDEGVVYTIHSGFLNDMALDNDGRILLGGTQTRKDSSAFIQLLRLTPEGIPDTTFSEDGVVTTEIEQDTQLSAITLDAEGKIIAVGVTRILDSSDDNKFLVLRYDTQGNPDTFGPLEQGFTTIDFVAEGENASAVTLDATGRILAAGGSSFSSMVLTRLEPDGFPDTTFGPIKDGKVVLELGNEVQGLALDSKGRILMAGTTGSVLVENPEVPPQGNQALLVVRLDAQGNLDKTYGTNGGTVVKLELPETNVLARVTATLLDKQEGLILVGRRLNLATEDNDIVLTRIR